MKRLLLMLLLAAFALSPLLAEANAGPANSAPSTHARVVKAKKHHKRHPRKRHRKHKKVQKTAPAVKSSVGAVK
jgi:Ni/Co efflux regulator RcnB